MTGAIIIITICYYLIDYGLGTKASANLQHLDTTPHSASSGRLSGGVAIHPNRKVPLASEGSICLHLQIMCRDSLRTGCV